MNSQAELFPVPVQPRPIDVLFYEELKERKNDNSRIGDLARTVLKQGTQPGDLGFPNWRDFYNLDEFFAGMADISLVQYQKWRDRNKDK